MQFLKNFYTVLDYESNTIRIGVNKAGPSAKSGASGIKESTTSEENEAEPSNTLLIIILVIFVGVISFFVYKRYKEDK